MKKEKVSDFIQRQLCRILGVVDLILLPIKIPVIFVIGIIMSIKYKEFIFPGIIYGAVIGIKIVAKEVVTGNGDEVYEVLSYLQRPTELG